MEDKRKHDGSFLSDIMNLFYCEINTNLLKVIDKLCYILYVYCPWYIAWVGTTGLNHTPVQVGD